MIKPWENRVTPYKLYGNLYFCGSLCGSCHLIAGSDGLILIDVGYPQTLYLLLENIRALGFDPRDIRHIIISHGHYDHLGGVRELIELYHPTTYIGEPDRCFANGEKDLTWAAELGYRYLEAFEPDVLIKDGDSLDIGGIRFDFMITPGHTPGTLSLFFDTDGEDGRKRCGMFGGSGLNTLSLRYLNRAGLPVSLRDDFLRSIERLLPVNVDIHIGNHCQNNLMFEKLKLREETGVNAFIDPTDWQRHLENCRSGFAALCARELAAGNQA